MRIQYYLVNALLFSAMLPAMADAERPLITKLGTLDCDMVETTPLVWGNRLHRFEYVRENYHANKTGQSYFRIIEVGNGRTSEPFAQGFHLGSAFVHQGTVYVYAVPRWGGDAVHVFWSRDLENWESQPALELPGWGIYNTAVCASPQGFTMAFEIGEPPEEVGSRFTIRFATSPDLKSWTLTEKDHVYSREKYSACPTLRYLDGQYYMIYLEASYGEKGSSYAPHIVRSGDLVTWEESPRNPMMRHGAADKRIANPALTDAQRTRIKDAVNVNNSDLDLCEFRGETHIVYSWGDQRGTEHLAEARYNGRESDLLKAYFE
jgi:hypothetical protein